MNLIPKVFTFMPLCIDDNGSFFKPDFSQNVNFCILTVSKALSDLSVNP